MKGSDMTYINVLKLWETQKPLARASGKAVWILIDRAIKKQIPMKPLAHDDCEKFYIKCTCGKCTDTRFFHGYCTWCGQRLE